MLSLLREIWGRVQEDIKSKAGDAAYGSWIADLRPLALERGTCFLEAPSRMACERIQRLYAPLLEECISGEMGTRISVRVSPAPDAVLSDDLEVSPTRPVVDECNKTSFLVLQNLVEKTPGLPSNLFLFYGEAGVGKTYLLRWWRDLSGDRAVIRDGLALRKAFQIKVRDQKVADLEQELTDPRPLVIDGVHRFSRHRRAQRELGRILKARGALDILTLITSRWHPREIWDLDPVLESFLLSGFVSQIKLPGHSARLRYLRALEGSAARNGRASAVETLARKVSGSFRDLQRAWALERHGLQHERHGRYLQLIDPSREFRRILDRVVERLGVPREELLGKGQARRITRARQALAWLLVKAGLSQAEVGRHMNGRSRAAISYCVKTIEKRMANSHEVRKLVEGLL